MFAVFVVAVLSFALLLNRVVTQSFSELESETIVRDSARVQAVFESNVAAMRAVSGDWARRTDVYDFMAGRNPGYAEDNLTGDLLSTIHADFICFFDADGGVYYSAAVDPETKETVELSTSCQQAIVTLNRESPTSGEDGGTRSGLVSLPDGPAAIAFEEISDGDGSVPPNGTLAVGRFLGREEIAEAKRVSKVNVLAARPVVRASVLPQHPHGEGEQLGRAYVDAHDSETIESWATLRGLDGRAALFYVVSEARPAMERASDTVRYMGFGLFGVVLLFGTALGVTMERVIMRRLTTLHDEVIRTSRNDVTNRRLTVDGDDEIAELAVALNRNFDGLAEAEAALKHAADHDYLTGLVNRRRLEEDTARALAESDRTGESVAYILLDLDGFKDINDTRGHHCGDAVLVWFAELLRSEVRRYSTVARVGGDEFAIMLPRAGDYEAAVVADRLMTALSENPCDLCTGDSFVIGASVGIAVSPRDGGDMGQLTSAADYAMYATKSSRARDSLGLG